MKLEVGMYVRTKWGIDKIKDIVLNGNFYEDSGLYLEKNGKLICGKEGMKELRASHNIGELLEAGDFLDFHCIEKIEDTTIYLTDGWFIDFDDVEDLVGTICTREQFENMSYKVGE